MIRFKYLGINYVIIDDIIYKDVSPGGCAYCELDIVETYSFEDKYNDICIPFHEFSIGWNDSHLARYSRMSLFMSIFALRYNEKIPPDENGFKPCF